MIKLFVLDELEHGVWEYNISFCINDNVDEKILIDGIKYTGYKKCYDNIHCFFKDKYRKDIYYLPEGKPFIKGSKYISISHVKGISVLVYADFEIGVDIEMINEFYDINSVRFLNSNEFNTFKDDEKNTLACRLWTIKESCLKLIGTGLNVSPKEITTDKSFCVSFNHEKFSSRSYKYKDCIISLCRKRG